MFHTHVKQQKLAFIFIF